MAFQLWNEVDPVKTVILTQAAWYGIMDLALEYGWNPVGAVMPGGWVEAPLDLYGYGLDEPVIWYGETPESRLVVIEDALNLGDALERAFIAYEHTHQPASYFLFNGDDRSRPSIGALLAVCDLCRMGAFRIDEYRP